MLFSETCLWENLIQCWQAIYDQIRQGGSGLLGFCGSMAELEHNQGAPTPQNSMQQNKETSLNAQDDG